MHQRIQPAGVFEPVTGLYAQVVACDDGPRFEIAGTLPYRPTDDTSRERLPSGLREQCEVMMDNIQRSLDSVDLLRSDVVRIRVFTTRMDEFLRDGLQTVFGFFGDHRPTSTLVEVSRLANPAVLVEMDATAVRAPR